MDFYNQPPITTLDIGGSECNFSYVYRKGLLEYNWSFSTVVGLFNSVINVTLLVIANQVSKKLSGGGLW